MRAAMSSTSDSALSGSSTERCRSREGSSTAMRRADESAGGGTLGAEPGTGGGFGSGGFFEGIGGGFAITGIGVAFFCGSGGGIDFFFPASGGSGGGIDDRFGGAGASSLALGRTISDVGTARINFDGGSPDAI